MVGCSRRRCELAPSQTHLVHDFVKLLLRFEGLQKVGDRYRQVLRGQITAASGAIDESRFGMNDWRLGGSPEFRAIGTETRDLERDEARIDFA